MLFLYLWLVAIQNKQEKKLKRDEACAQATMNRKQSEDIFQQLCAGNKLIMFKLKLQVLKDSGFPFSTQAREKTDIHAIMKS